MHEWSRIARLSARCVTIALLTGLGGCASWAQFAQTRRTRTFQLSMTPRDSTPCPDIEIGYDPYFAASEGASVYEGLRLRVEYPTAMDSRAGPFAERLDVALDQVWGRLDLKLEQTPLLQLSQADCWPAEFAIEAKWPSARKFPYLPIPLIVLPPAAPMSEQVGGLALPSSMIFALAHELTEQALATAPRGTVLADAKHLKIFRSVHGTRWFREGLASYAAVGVCERLGLHAPLSRERGEATLDRVGPAVLEWTAFGNRPEDSALFYAASLGLVARMIDGESPDSIGKLMLEIRRHDYVDGERLKSAIRIAYGRPVESFFSASADDANADRGR